MLRVKVPRAYVVLERMVLTSGEPRLTLRTSYDYPCEFCMTYRKFQGHFQSYLGLTFRYYYGLNSLISETQKNTFSTKRAFHDFWKT